MTLTTLQPCLKVKVAVPKSFCEPWLYQRVLQGCQYSGIHNWILLALVSFKYLNGVILYSLSI